MKQFSKDLGNVSLAPKGRWSKEQEYERLNLVYNDCDNLSYVAKIDVPIGVEIDNREYWQPMNATGYADNNFINLTTESETGTVTAYESLEEAVATILPINRRAGATLSFYNLNVDRLDRQAEFELWQFNSTNLANWENRDYWNNIYYNWNVFAGWYVGADGLKNHVKIPNVGQYAYVGTNLNDALLYQCRTNGTWTNTGIKVRNYISVVVSGNITIGENGNWFSDGKDTGIPATPAVDEQLDNIIIQLQQHTTEINNLKVSDANLQDQITSNDSDITNLTAKHESLSRTVQGIAATGGASIANNVTYNNDASKLNAENVQDAIDEVNSIVTYDVSARNGKVVFESLQSLLSSSNLNALIPASVRHGGMSIRFIQGSEQSSDNKYVQYRLMLSTFTTAQFTNVANWQGVDDEPTAGSDNLVKSGGVLSKSLKNVPIKSSDELLDKSQILANKSCTYQGVIQDNINGWCVSPLVLVNSNIPLWINTYNFYLYNSTTETFVKKISNNVTGSTLKSLSSSLTDESYKIRLEFKKEDIDNVRIGLTPKENLVKDYFDYDNKPTKNSNAIIQSKDLYQCVGDTEDNITFELSAGSNIYSILSGTNISFKNVGALVNITYKTDADSESKTIINDFNTGDIYDWVAPEEVAIINISKVADAKVVLYIGKGSIIQRLNTIESTIQDNLKIEETEAVLHGGANNYNIVSGIEYTFKNTGSDIVNVYYKIDSETTSVKIASDLEVGNTIKWTAPENATIISVSKVTGAEVTVTTREVGTIIQRIETLESVVKDNPFLLRVATFNVGDYTGKDITIGTDEAKLAYRKLLGELNADIIGTQEDVANYDGGDVKSAFWGMFKYYERKGGREYNYKAFASDYKIENVRLINYTGEYYYNHYYFLAGDLVYNDKTILLTSFHFDWNETEVRTEQIRQIIAYAANYDYVIMMGDTNSQLEEWNTFSAAGYSMANNGYFGSFDTVDYDYPTGEQKPLDNIFVKGNIVIRNVNIIVKDWTNDHCVLYADIAVY